MASNKEFAIIVGRFQCSKLTEGHKHLISKPAEDGIKRLILYIGTNDVNPTDKNPLDYPTVELMIDQYLEESRFYWTTLVHPIQDATSNKKWAEKLAKDITTTLSVFGKDFVPVFYGGRDSFLDITKDHLKELLPQSRFVEVEELKNISATKERQKIIDPENNESFRSGVIYSQNTRFPCIYPVVESIVFDQENQQVLVGRKSGDNNKLYRFIGGFVDTKDESCEAAAIRELKEETYAGIAEFIEYPRIIGSSIIESSRMKGSKDRMMSTIVLFNVCKNSGDKIELKAGDDLAEVAWVKLKDLKDKILPGHQRIYEIFNNHLMDVSYQNSKK